MIKKGELYKDKVVHERIKKENEQLTGCTFRPKLNDERNKRR
jgi:hypothetical protein